MLVGLGVVAVFMAVVFAVQAVSTDSRPSDTRSSVEENGITPTSVAPEVGLVTTLPSEMTATTIEIQGPPRVSIYGDSLAAGFGDLLKSNLDRQGVTTFLATKGSSGLSQPGFFDWPNHLNVWVPQENADVIVIGLGANDGQDVKVDGVSYSPEDPEWSIEYERRVTELVTVVTSEGRSLVWVGTPDGKGKAFRANLAILRTATKNAIDAARANGTDVVYLDTWSLFLGLDGNYSQYVIDPSDGERKKFGRKQNFGGGN
jgi:hypothetical protein